MNPTINSISANKIKHIPIQSMNVLFSGKILNSNTVSMIRINPMIVIAFTLRTFIIYFLLYNNFSPHSGQNFGLPLITVSHFEHLRINDVPHSGQNLRLFASSGVPHFGQGTGNSYPQASQADAPSDKSLPHLGQGLYLLPHEGQNLTSVE
jgi:hypothetical protein